MEIYKILCFLDFYVKLISRILFHLTLLSCGWFIQFSTEAMSSMEVPSAWNWWRLRDGLQVIKIIEIIDNPIKLLYFIGTFAAYTIEAVIMQLSATLVKGKARIKFDAPKVSFFLQFFFLGAIVFKYFFFRAHII